MRIVAWNAQHGGGQRAAKFAERLADFKADVVVITEFRNNPSGRIISEILQDRGIAHFASYDTEPRINSVGIGARSSFEFAPLGTLGANEHRCMRADIGGLKIFAFYFPQKEKKVPIFEAICQLDSTLLRSDSMLIGDFNTGRHYVDEVGKSFYASEYLKRLEEIGWVDAWRSRNLGVSEYSWYSRAGNGFRIDHAFASKSLNQRIQNITFEHGVREDGLSDHSAIVIDIEDC